MKRLYSLFLTLPMMIGCVNTNEYRAKYSVEAQTDYPWKLEFFTDADLIEMQKWMLEWVSFDVIGSAKMCITLEHPNIGKDKKLVLSFEESNSGMVSFGYPVEYIEGVPMRTAGWYAIVSERLGFYGWPRHLSDIMVSFMRDSKDDILMGKSVVVYFKAIDFPDEGACERYLKAYDTHSEVIALNEDGMRVLVDCYKYRNNSLASHSFVE